MIRQLLVILVFASTNLLSQTILTQEDFLKKSKTFPKNYKELVGAPKGWRILGRYDLHYSKIIRSSYKWDTLHKFTPFRDGKMFSKIRRNKIIGRGDIRGVVKIIYVSTDTLILENKAFQKVKGKNQKVRVRTLYKRA